VQTENIYRVLNEIFHDVFDDESIRLTSETTAQDIPGWDSRSHISLIVSAEARFGVKFRTAEVEGLKNVGHLAEVIQRHLGGAR
jgi:acyl carrier protein